MPTDKREKIEANKGERIGEREALYLQEELALLPFQDVSIGSQRRAAQCLVTAKRTREKRE